MATASQPERSRSLVPREKCKAERVTTWQHAAVQWRGADESRGWVRLAYRWHAPPPSKLERQPLTLLCLHGSLCDSTWFDCLEPTALETPLPRCQCLVVDLPGHGASERIAHSIEYGAPAELECMASALSSLLVHLDVLHDSWAVLGHSLGGAVALLLARETRTCKAPLFFISLEGNTTPMDCAPAGRARKVAALIDPPSSGEVMEIVEVAAVWPPMAQRIGPSLGILAHQIWTSLVKLSDSGELEAIARTCQLLYIYGMKSDKLHGQTLRLLETHPSAKSEGIEGASHFMLSDRPQETISAFNSLMEGLI